HRAADFRSRPAARRRLCFAVDRGNRARGFSAGMRRRLHIDHDVLFPTPEAVLTTLFDLTPAEARVLLRVGSGLNASKTALSLGIGENTLKTHLNRIFAKTGTRRQADLVKLISDIGTPLVPAGS
ncbi:helix-turn-helix transcriptional regulator, partial [Mesorhizobium sp.]|uniref:helix-turn-helix transcriptional regulator n=1 Tax=Mesorhizobium sp. TaxID=1871066 RepID=UPI0025D68A34